MIRKLKSGKYRCIPARKIRELANEKISARSTARLRRRNTNVRFSILKGIRVGLGMFVGTGPWPVL